MAFNLTIDSFGITQTRSKHQDTDYVALTVKAGAEPMLPAVMAVGNVNNGTHQVQLSSSFDLGQNDLFTFNYLIVNAGSTNIDQARAALEATGAAWANGGGPSAPHLSSANGIDTDYLVAQLNSIFRSTCDGIVAAEQNQFSYGDLIALMSGNSFSHQTAQPGTHSPSGCGNNSQYTVTWHVANAVMLPDVTGKPELTAQEILTNLGFSVGTSGKGDTVSTQTPPPGPVDAGSRVTLALISSKK